jgi:SpoVK/Ycf46/Vps4 family AAA+-type ATPase
MQTITPSQLSKLLLNVALTRPVFIWGPPGIGKSALVEQFAQEVGLDCVSLLGSQLAKTLPPEREEEAHEHGKPEPGRAAAGRDPV